MAAHLLFLIMCTLALTHVAPVRGSCASSGITSTSLAEQTMGPACTAVDVTGSSFDGGALFVNITAMMATNAPSLSVRITSTNFSGSSANPGGLWLEATTPTTGSTTAAIVITLTNLRFNNSLLAVLRLKVPTVRVTFMIQGCTFASQDLWFPRPLAHAFGTSALVDSDPNYAASILIGDVTTGASSTLSVARCAIQFASTVLDSNAFGLWMTGTQRLGDSSTFEVADNSFDIEAANAAGGFRHDGDAASLTLASAASYSLRRNTIHCVASSAAVGISYAQVDVTLRSGTALNIQHQTITVKAFQAAAGVSFVEGSLTASGANCSLLMTDNYVRVEMLNATGTGRGTGVSFSKIPLIIESNGNLTLSNNSFLFSGFGACDASLVCRGAEVTAVSFLGSNITATGGSALSFRSTRVTQSGMVYLSGVELDGSPTTLQDHSFFEVVGLQADSLEAISGELVTFRNSTVSAADQSTVSITDVRLVVTGSTVAFTGVSWIESALNVSKGSTVTVARLDANMSSLSGTATAVVIQGSASAPPQSLLTDGSQFNIRSVSVIALTDALGRGSVTLVAFRDGSQQVNVSNSSSITIKDLSGSLSLEPTAFLPTVQTEAVAVRIDSISLALSSNSSFAISNVSLNATHRQFGATLLVSAASMQLQSASHFRLFETATDFQQFNASGGSAYNYLVYVEDSPLTAIGRSIVEFADNKANVDCEAGGSFSAFSWSTSPILLETSTLNILRTAAVVSALLNVEAIAMYGAKVNISTQSNVSISGFTLQATAGSLSDGSTSYYIYGLYRDTLELVVEKQSTFLTQDVAVTVADDGNMGEGYALYSGACRYTISDESRLIVRNSRWSLLGVEGGAAVYHDSDTIQIGQRSEVLWEKVNHTVMANDGLHWTAMTWDSTDLTLTDSSNHTLRQVRVYANTDAGLLMSGRSGAAITASGGSRVTFDTLDLILPLASLGFSLSDTTYLDNSTLEIVNCNISTRTRTTSTAIGLQMEQLALTSSAALLLHDSTITVASQQARQVVGILFGVLDIQLNSSVLWRNVSVDVEDPIAALAGLFRSGDMYLYHGSSFALSGMEIVVSGENTVSGYDGKGQNIEMEENSTWTVTDSLIDVSNLGGGNSYGFREGQRSKGSFIWSIMTDSSFTIRNCTVSVDAPLASPVYGLSIAMTVSLSDRSTLLVSDSNVSVTGLTRVHALSWQPFEGAYVSIISQSIVLLTGNRFAAFGDSDVTAVQMVVAGAGVRMKASQYILFSNTMIAKPAPNAGTVPIKVDGAPVAGDQFIGLKWQCDVDARDASSIDVRQCTVAVDLFRDSGFGIIVSGKTHSYSDRSRLLIRGCAVKVHSTYATVDKGATGIVGVVLKPNGLTLDTNSVVTVASSSFDIAADASAAIGLVFYQSKMGFQGGSSVWLDRNRMQVVSRQNLCLGITFAASRLAFTGSTLSISRNVLSAAMDGAGAVTGAVGVAAILLDPSSGFDFFEGSLFSVQHNDLSVAASDAALLTAALKIERLTMTNSTWQVIGNNLTLSRGGWLYLPDDATGVAPQFANSTVVVANNIARSESVSAVDGVLTAWSATTPFRLTIDPSTTVFARCNTHNGTAVTQPEYANALTSSSAASIVVVTDCRKCDVRLDCGDPMAAVAAVGSAPTDCTCRCAGGYEGPSCGYQGPFSYSKSFTLSPSGTSSLSSSASPSQSATLSISPTESEESLTITASVAVSESLVGSESRSIGHTESITAATSSLTVTSTVSTTPLRDLSNPTYTDSASITASVTVSATEPSPTVGTMSGAVPNPVIAVPPTATATISPTLSIVRPLVTNPPGGSIVTPGCHASPVPAPQLFQSATEEGLLRNQTFVAVFSVPVASQWFLAGIPGDHSTLNSTWYTIRILQRTRDDVGAPSSRGIAAVAGNSILLSRINASAFQITIPPLPTLSIEENERIEIVLNPGYFTACPPATIGGVAAGVVLGYLDVVAAANPTATAAHETVVAVSTVALASGALAMGAAMDAQSLAVLGMMVCAKPLDRKVMQNPRLLSPLATSDSFEGMILGNLILIAAVAVLQGCVIVARRRFAKASWQHARMFAKFPGFLFTVGCLAYQGTGLAAVKVLSLRSDIPPLVLGVFSVSFAIVMPVFVALVVRRYVTAQYHLYDFELLREGKWKGAIRHLFPYGRWEPKKVTSAYGGMFAGLRRAELVWCTLPLWGPSIMVIGASFRPSTPEGCEIQYGCLAVLQFLIFLVLAAVRPFRSFMGNTLAPFSSLCLGLVLTSNAIAVRHDSPTIQQFTIGCVYAQMVVTLLRVIQSTTQTVVEGALFSTAPKLPTNIRRVGTKAKNRSTTGAAEGNPATGGFDDDEMKLFAEVPRADDLEAPMLQQLAPAAAAPTYPSSVVVPHSWPQEERDPFAEDEEDPYGFLRPAVGRSTAGPRLPPVEDPRWPSSPPPMPMRDPLRIGGPLGQVSRDQEAPRRSAVDPFDDILPAPAPLYFSPLGPAAAGGRSQPTAQPFTPIATRREYIDDLL